MAADFDHIFCGIRSRRSVEGSDYLVDAVGQLRQACGPRPPISAQSKQSLRNRPCSRPGKTHDANASPPRRSRNGNDGVVELHGVAPAVLPPAARPPALPSRAAASRSTAVAVAIPSTAGPAMFERLR